MHAQLNTLAILTLGETNLPQSLLFVAGVSLLTIWLMMRLVRKARKRGPQLSAKEQITRNQQARGMRGDLEDLMVEIEQMAKRMSAQLDAKAMNLERLLDAADGRIAELRRLEQSSPGGSVKKSASASNGATNAAALAAADRSADEGRDPLAREVYRLADEGRDPTAIARQLDEHIGKVELILALRQV